jgi:hypothetical protein
MPVPAFKIPSCVFTLFIRSVLSFVIVFCGHCFLISLFVLTSPVSLDSSVGIATGYGLDGPGIESL